MQSISIGWLFRQGRGAELTVTIGEHTILLSAEELDDLINQGAAVLEEMHWAAAEYALINGCHLAGTALLYDRFALQPTLCGQLVAAWQSRPILLQGPPVAEMCCPDCYAVWQQTNKLSIEEDT